MRWLLAMAVLLALVLGVLLAGRTGRRERPPAAATKIELPSEDLAEPAVAPEVEPDPDSSVEGRRAVEPLQQVALSDAPAPSECAVFGRVVDGDDRPLPEVAVRLEAYKVWAEGHEVPRLPGKYDLHGWEVRTEAGGSFRFVTPVPTASRTSLRITPDPFHDSVWEILGGEDALAPLHAGDNDLGVFRLVATGAIGGLVTDEAGRPLADAHLRIAEDRSSTLGRECDSDASGSYLLGHVKPGSYGVNVECKGYLSEFRKPFQVEPGGVTAGVDFVLRPAPALRGVVVDEEGRGLAGAKLHGWPSSSGSGAGARSEADGSFTVFLPQDEPYTLEVELEGYETFGLDDRSTHHAPGTSDLRIVLERSANARTLFVVVDAASGAPIERFGLEVERDRGSASERNSFTSYQARPEPAHHPGGQLGTAARPGLDLFTVCAPGYVRQSGDVRHEAADSPRQVVEMVAGGTLTGRVLDAGVPAAGAAVRLQPGEVDLAEDGSRVFDPDSSARGGVAMFATSSDGEGRFRFDMLDPGTYRLLVSHRGGAIAELVPLEVPESGPVDAGDLALALGATILGQVLVPPRRSTAGLVVYLDDWREGATRMTDDLGRFRFEGVTAGRHTLLLGEVPGQLDSTSREVTLAAGETREVVIDARDRGTCNVALTIELAGRPAEGMDVVLLPLADPRRRLELGTTGADGRVAGSVPAAGEARVEIAVAGWTRLVHPNARLELELDREVEALVGFEVGSLLLRLPGSLVLPERCSAALTLVAADGTVDRRHLDLAGSGARARGLALEDGRSLRCENVLAGEYEATLALTAADAPLERIPEGSGFRFERRALYRTGFHASIRAGEATEIQLR